jgi:predicted phosphodiesterase
MGNVEESLAADAGNCGCGFAKGSDCDRLSAQWYGFASTALDPEAKRWMADLPKAVRFTLGERRLLVVHGAPSSVNRFIFASTPAAELAAEIEASGCDGVVAGHCGLPFTRFVKGRLWHNAGVVGMPANDGTPRAWYSLLRPRADGISLEHRAFTYGHARAAAKVRIRGLPEGYAKALETGLWPSVDILPPPERTRSGIALEPKCLFWIS